MGRVRGSAAGSLAIGLLAACSSWSEPGVRVELATHADLRTGQELRSGLGVIRVEALSWTSSEIELQACGTALGSLERWLVPSAHAHGLSSPTRLAVPSVVSATLNESFALGELQPPAGRYCAVRYRMGPADADARGLSAVPEMLDHSLLLRAEYGTGAAPRQPFELRSRLDFELSRPIELELSAEHPLARLELELDAERWLVGIDLGSLSGAEREQALLTLFRAALDVRVE